MLSMTRRWKMGVHASSAGSTSGGGSCSTKGFRAWRRCEDTFDYAYSDNSFSCQLSCRAYLLSAQRTVHKFLITAHDTNL